MFWNKKKIWDVAAHLIVVVVFVAIGAGQVLADFTFSTPANLGPTVNSFYLDAGPCISGDGLSLFYNSLRPGGSGGIDLWITTRETTSEPWGEPVNLGPTVNSSSNDGLPNISADGLTLHFNSNRPGGFGGEDIYVTTRTTTDDDWEIPVNLGPIVNSSAGEFGMSISADGLALYFASQRPNGYGSYDIWITKRTTTDDDWNTPENLGPIVNSSASSAAPEISADGLALLFACDRPGGYDGGDLWIATRQTTTDPWGEPVNLGPIVSSSYFEGTPGISADGSTLYFGSNRPGGIAAADLWQTSITPVVDLNGDSIVDATDMCIMVDYWGTDEPLCDIAPLPFGDGIVDVQDLIVLAEHLFEDVRLVAHWKLDETEGDVASDSADSHNAALSGDPIWQPADGKIDGALVFDGVDDYISTPFVLNTADSACSAFVWVKGATLGQVIISQTDGTGFGGTWLGLDPSDGKLFTTLMFVELKSESVIPDDEWHHLGLVWDGSLRYLYLDGVEIAKDTSALSYALSCDGGLNIGVDKDLSTSSLFSGLIDDVRIYDAALSAEEIATMAQ